MPYVIKDRKIGEYLLPENEWPKRSMRWSEEYDNPKCRGCWTPDAMRAARFSEQDYDDIGAGEEWVDLTRLVLTKPELLESQGREGA